MTTKGNPILPIRMDQKRKDAFIAATVAAGTTTADVVRKSIAWWMREPGAELPHRPTREITTMTTTYAETWQASVHSNREILIDRPAGHFRGRDQYAKPVELPTWTGSTAADWDAALAARGYERVTDWDQDSAGTTTQVKLVTDTRPVAVRYRASLLNEGTGQWVVVDDAPIVGAYKASQVRPSVDSTPDGRTCYRARVETLAADGSVLDTRDFDLV